MVICFANAEHGDSFLLHVLRFEDLPRLPETSAH